MLFASTTISNGACIGVVTATGMSTEIGAIQDCITSSILVQSHGTPRIQKRIVAFIDWISIRLQLQGLCFLLGFPLRRMPSNWLRVRRSRLKFGLCHALHQGGHSLDCASGYCTSQQDRSKRRCSKSWMTSATCWPRRLSIRVGIPDMWSFSHSHLVISS